MLPARDVSVGPCSPSLTRLLGGLVLSRVGFHLLSPMVVVGDPWLSRSSGELWVAGSPLFFAQMDLTSIVDTLCPAHGGVCHLHFRGALVLWPSGGSLAGDALGNPSWLVRASFLFDDRGRCGGRSVYRDIYSLRAFLGSTGGIVRLCILHC